VVRAAWTYAVKRRQFGFAARGLYRANRKHEAMRGQENNGGIAMLMIGWSIRMMMAGRIISIMVVVVCPTLVMIAPAELDITGQGIGEMQVMMGVIDAVHQRDVRLSGQHDSQRHAQNGHRASQRDKALTTQLCLALGSPTRQNAGNLAQLRTPATPGSTGSVLLPRPLQQSRQEHGYGGRLHQKSAVLGPIALMRNQTAQIVPISRARLIRSRCKALSSGKAIPAAMTRSVVNIAHPSA